MQTPFGGSRFKTVPYLFVHSRQTEGETAFGGYGEVDPRGSGTYSNTVSLLLTYDAYCQGEDGGPILDFWWKMENSFSGTVACNYGGRGSLTGTLTVPFGAGDLTYSATYVVATTRDLKSVWGSGGFWAWFNANSILVSGSDVFTAGGWYNVPGIADGQLLFRSNMGGSQGRYRGVEIYHPQSADYLIVSLGTNKVSGGQLYYRYQTASGTFPLNQRHFVALVVNPAPTVAGTSLKMYIDGVERTLTYNGGTGLSVAWVITASDINGWNGIAYGAAGDTYGGRLAGYYDELFFHWAEITAEQIAEMWNRGTND